VKLLKNKIKISCIILTFNEEKHIRRCISNLKNIFTEVIVVDSYSSDRTEKICKKYKNVKFFKNKFINQSHQLNWALKKINFSSDWIFRIDADEIITKELSDFLLNNFDELSKKYKAFLFNRKVNFLGKIINFGSTSPHKTLRLWKKKFGKIPIVHMDEQVYVKGKIKYLNYDLIDHNLNSFSWWIKKHLNYAQREKKNYFSLVEKENNLNYDDLSKISKKNKIFIYYKFPIFLRPVLLYFYCNIIKFGILSGWQGFIYHFFQIFLYRFYVDYLIFVDKFLFKNKKSA